MTEIARKQTIAQGYLDRATPDHGPLFDLPPAIDHFVRHKPELQEKGVASCGAKARLEEPHEIPYGPSVVSRSKVTCKLVPGHTGPHVARVQHELPGVWRVLSWPQ